MLHSALHPGFSHIHGAGVIAVHEVPQGTAAWWPCPRCRVLPADQQPGTPQDVLSWLAEYGYRRADGGLIAPCQGAFLFNHSCEASVLDAGLSVGITVRDVSKGEEVTCDYRGFRYEDPWSFRCRCGTARCIGTVTSTAGPLPADLAREWSLRIGLALEAAPSLPQEITILSGDIHGTVTARGADRGW
jgi:hypothetical protein